MLIKQQSKQDLIYRQMLIKLCIVIF